MAPSLNPPGRLGETTEGGCALYLGPSLRTNELPIGPKTLRIRPRKYFFHAAFDFDDPRLQKYRSKQKNQCFKNHDFQKIGRKVVKIDEICIFFRAESDFDQPGVPR